jgi:hypothetical protein
VQDGEIVQIDIRDKMNVPSLESFSSRKEFNEWKYETEKFNKGVSSRSKFKRNIHGLAVTEQFMLVAENLNKKEIRLAKKLRDRIISQPFTVGGVEQGSMEQRLLTMGRNNPQNIHIPKPFDFSQVKTLSRLKEVFDNMKNRSSEEKMNRRLERFKELYMESLERQFNSDADDVLEMIKEIPADVFYEMYKIEDVFEILFDPSPQEGYSVQWVDESNMSSQLGRIESYLERYYRGELNFDLKGLFER